MPGVVEARRNPRFYMTPGRYAFRYGRYKHDPMPESVVLGTFKHPTTGNVLVAGINLHYLNAADRRRVVEKIKPLFAPKTLYERYWKGKRILPGIMEQAYRTYKIQFITRTTDESVGMMLRSLPDGKLEMVALDVAQAVEELNNVPMNEGVDEKSPAPPADPAQWQQRTPAAHNSLEYWRRMNPTGTYSDPAPEKHFTTLGQRYLMRPEGGKQVLHYISSDPSKRAVIGSFDSEQQAAQAALQHHQTMGEDVDEDLIDEMLNEAVQGVYEAVKATPEEFARLKKIVASRGVGKVATPTVRRPGQASMPVSTKRSPLNKRVTPGLRKSTFKLQPSAKRSPAQKTFKLQAATRRNVSTGFHAIPGMRKPIAPAIAAKLRANAKTVAKQSATPAAKPTAQQWQNRQQYNSAVRKLHSKLQFKLGQVNQHYASGKLTRMQQIGARQNLFRASHQIANHFAKKHGVDSMYHQSFGVGGINKSITRVPLGMRPKPPVQSIVPKTNVAAGGNPVNAGHKQTVPNRTAPGTALVKQKKPVGFLHRIGTALQGAFKGSGLKQEIQKHVAAKAAKHPMLAGAIRGAIKGWRGEHMEGLRHMLTEMESLSDRWSREHAALDADMKAYHAKHGADISAIQATLNAAPLLGTSALKPGDIVHSNVYPNHGVYRVAKVTHGGARVLGVPHAGGAAVKLESPSHRLAVPGGYKKITADIADKIVQHGDAADAMHAKHLSPDNYRNYLGKDHPSAGKTESVDVLGNAIIDTNTYVVAFPDESVEVMTGAEIGNAALQEAVPGWVTSQQAAGRLEKEYKARAASRDANTASSVAVTAKQHKAAADAHEKAYYAHGDAHLARGGRKEDLMKDPSVMAHFNAHTDHLRQYHAYYSRTPGAPTDEAGDMQGRDAAMYARHAHNASALATKYPSASMHREAASKHVYAARMHTMAGNHDAAATHMQHAIDHRAHLIQSESVVIYPFDETTQELTETDGIVEVSPPGYAGVVAGLKQRGIPASQAFELAWGAYKRGVQESATLGDKIEPTEQHHLRLDREREFTDHKGNEYRLERAHFLPRETNRANVETAPDRISVKAYPRITKGAKAGGWSNNLKYMETHMDQLHFKPRTKDPRFESTDNRVEEVTTKSGANVEALTPAHAKRLAKYLVKMYGDPVDVIRQRYKDHVHYVKKAQEYPELAQPGTEYHTAKAYHDHYGAAAVKQHHCDVEAHIRALKSGKKAVGEADDALIDLLADSLVTPARGFDESGIPAQTVAAALLRKDADKYTAQGDFEKAKMHAEWADQMDAASRSGHNPLRPTTRLSLYDKVKRKA